jgi:hypothetical protein
MSAETTKAFISEYKLGRRTWKNSGDSMHVFLPTFTPEFAAIIPKGEYATVCLLGKIDKHLIKTF